MVKLLRKVDLILLIFFNIAIAADNETHCSDFRCKNQECIPIQRKCDGKNDCTDGSDEEICPVDKSRFPACTGDRFHCGDGLCVFKHEVCDGVKDCPNGAEELNCTIRNCTAQEYQCPVSKRCIPESNVCDGDEDCLDGSDEDIKNCTPLHNVLTSATSFPKECEEFSCKSTGMCLPWSKVCNGHEYCSDASDEGGLCLLSCLKSHGCNQTCRKTPEGSVCLCENGFVLNQDGKTCDDINECTLPGHCSHFCNNTIGGFYCTCAEGYYLDDDSGKCKADGGPGILVYMMPDEIWGMYLDTSSEISYVKGDLTDMRGIDFDAADGLLFWSSFAEDTINTYNFDTKQQDTIIKDPLKATHVRRDWITKNIYYTDDDGSIKVCDKSGKFCTTLLAQVFSEINSFAISPPNGLMFWSVWSTTIDDRYGIVERAELDGSHRKVIASDGIMYPAALIVDEVLKLIFWTDSKLNTLFYSDFHGYHRKEILIGEMNYPYSMTIFEDLVYWADWGTDSFIRCEKLTGNNCLQFRNGKARAEYLAMIHKVQQPQGENRCANNSCPHLCLLTRSSYRCECADADYVKNSSCHSATSSTSSTTEKTHLAMLESVNKCPPSYCEEDAKCTVENGNFSCWCPLGFTGMKCEVKSSLSEASDQTWVITVPLFMALFGVLGLAFLCRNKFHANNSATENSDFKSFEVITLGSTGEKQAIVDNRNSSSKSNFFSRRDITTI